MVNEPNMKTLQRLMSFSDGVVAIAITILILRIDLPTTLSASTVVPTIIQILPQLELYFISFIVIAYYWVEHHNIFVHAAYANEPLIWINIVFLMILCILPLSTDLAGTYRSFLTLTIYFANLSLSGILQAVMWFYALRCGQLENLNEAFIKMTSAKVLSVPVIFLLAIPVARFNTSVAAHMWVLVAVVHFFYRKIFGYKGKVSL